MPFFRKKPVVIEAVQWTGENWLKIDEFIGSYPHVTKPATRELSISILEGEHKASIGDWIIKGIAGEFYPCKPDIFEATYESAD